MFDILKYMTKTLSAGLSKNVFYNINEEKKTHNRTKSYFGRL